MILQALQTFVQLLCCPAILLKLLEVPRLASCRAFIDFLGFLMVISRLLKGCFMSSVEGIWTVVIVSLASVPLRNVLVAPVLCVLDLGLLQLRRWNRRSLCKHREELE